MSTSYRAVLRPAQRDGLCPVHLRITALRKHAYRHTGVAISPKFWNPQGKLENANWVRGSHPDAEVHNAAIQRLLRQAQDLALKQPNLTAEALRDLLKPQAEAPAAVGPDLLDELQREAQRRQGSGHPRSGAKYDAIRHKLQSFVLGIAHPKGRTGLASESAELQARRQLARLPVDSLSVRLMRDYESYLLALPNRPTTVQKELSFLNTVLLRLTEEGHLTDAGNPFKRMRKSAGLNSAKAKARPKAKLSEEEVARLSALSVEVLSRSAVQGSTVRKIRGRLWAREAWLLCYYLLGSRIGDALTLRWRDVAADAITFTEQKTGKLKVAPRHAELDAVLARLCPESPEGPDTFVLPYLNAGRWYAQFPAGLDWATLARDPAYRPKWVQLLKKIESATTTINDNLKQVAALAGIDKNLTAHTARHSFADRGRRLGVSATDMRDLLNHYSVSQTEEYFGELERSEISTVAKTIYAAR